MILDFLLQTLIAVIIFLGIAGAGIVITGFFGFKNKNPFLLLGIGYFISICLYVFLSAGLLFILPGKKMTLALFSLIYFLLSLVVIALYLKSSFKLHGLIAGKIWFFLGGLFFVLLIFFLGNYQTTIFDEHLHRPVVKYFMQNEQFPFIRPNNPELNFTNSYHYGLYLPVSATELIFKQGVSESLDILKFSYVIAAFCVFYGLIFHYTKKIKYSLFSAIVILICGGSFFFFDEFTINYLALWGVPKIAFSTPVLFHLSGITWINLALTFSFIVFMQEVFYSRSKFSLHNVGLFTILMAGFFLISELFAVLIIGLFGFSLLSNACLKKISFIRTGALVIFFILLLLPLIYLTGGTTKGVLSGIGKKLSGLTMQKPVTDSDSSSSGDIENSTAEKKTLQSSLIKSGKGQSRLLSLKPLEKWGYPSSKDIVTPSRYWLVYLRNYLLEILIIPLVAYFLIKKKIHFSEHALFFAATAVAMIVPFIFSTPFADINLAKLNHFWPIPLHAIFFILLSEQVLSKKIKAFYLILVVFGSVPLVAVNASVRWSNTLKARELRCLANPDCYSKTGRAVLERFEKKNPGIKKIAAFDQVDSVVVLDQTNSVSRILPKKITKEGINNQDKYDYIFYSYRMKQALTEEEKTVLEDFTAVERLGEYSILKAR